MSGFIRIEGWGDIEFLSASYDANLNELAKAEIEIPARKYPIYEQSVYKDIELYWFGQKVMSGFIVDYSNPDMNADGILAVTLTCHDELGRLAYFASANPDAHFADQTPTFIVSSLLAYAAGSGQNWALTDTSTVVEPTQKITGEARDKEDVFAQIKVVTEIATQFHIRYAGFNPLTNNHEIHAGLFGAIFDNFSPANNLVKFSRKKPTRRVLRDIDAISGRAGDSPVDLDGFMNIAPYPEYPIITDANGRKKVRNSALTKGGIITKRFNQVKGKNADTSSSDFAERAKVRDATYIKAVRELQSHNGYDTFSADVLVKSIPLLGDKGSFTASIDEIEYDDFMQTQETIRTFQVNADLRVVGVHIEFDTQASVPDEFFVEIEQGYFICTLDLTTNDYAELDDEQAELYEEKTDYTQADQPGATIGSIGSQFVTVNHTGVVADCGGGKTFTFNYVSPAPDGATGVFATYSLPPGATATVTQQATLLLPLILCVNAPGWVIGSNVTITVKYDFA